MTIANNMLRRLPDVYNKDSGSNNYKFFQLFSSEYEELKRVFEKIKAYRDIDQSKGAPLDSIGGNVLELRGNKNDIDYRKFIKTRIKSNLSAGDIETINEVATVLIGDAFIGVKETWNQQTYSNEEAGIVIINKGLGATIKTEYEDYLNEPTYLDGSFLLDGSHVLNGGLNFDYTSTEAERNETVIAIKEAIKRIVAGGVGVYYEVPEEVITDLDIQQDVVTKQSNNVANDVMVTHSVTDKLTQSATTSAVSRLDGMFRLDGTTLLDGKRDFAVHDVNITEVSA